MKTKDDWKELGVPNFGDLRILVNTSIASDYSTPSTTTTTTATVSEGMYTLKSFSRIHSFTVNSQSKMANYEGIDDVRYKPIIKLVVD